MPYTDQGLPFQSGAGSHTSYLGAKLAARTRREKTQRYLQYLFVVGPSTDQDAAVYLGFPLSSINSIRNAVMAVGLVDRGEKVGTRFQWQLSLSGRAAVQARGEE